MLPQILWIIASAILLFLSSLHLYYTFFSDKFSIRDAGVEESMKNTHPKLTRKTTVWKAWIGFNGSHSSGVMYMGLLNIYLAGWQYGLLSGSIFIKALTIITCLFLFYLGKRYWFDIPFRGIVIATVCYTLAIALM